MRKCLIGNIILDRLLASNNNNNAINNNNNINLHFPCPSSIMSEQRTKNRKIHTYTNNDRNNYVKINYQDLCIIEHYQFCKLVNSARDRKYISE